MNTPEKRPEQSAETFQVGVTPVQSFTSPVIAITPDTVLEPRFGMPARAPEGQPPIDPRTGDLPTPPVANP